MKKIITVTTILLVSLLFLTYNLYNKENISNTKINKNNNMLSIMLETEVGSGNYEVSDLNTWPKEGYVYNENLSNCENNTLINWSDETKSLSLKGNKTDKCYIYFDKYTDIKINNYSITPNGNKITILMNASNGTGTISKYYYSKDNGLNYLESTSNTYTFTGLTKGTYNIKLYIIDSYGRKSKVISQTVEISENQFSQYIISKYTGTQGTNGIYYHDSTLTNGAGDNSYRFAGSNPSNYVCFGSDEDTCPDNNLYRIIGVFNNQVKLIKADYANNDLLGTNGEYSKKAYEKSAETTYKGSLTTIDKYYYYKNSMLGITITWEGNNLRSTNLNSNYLNKIGDKWSNMIATINWKASGNEPEEIGNSIPSVTFQNEIVNPKESETVESKVGLMYTSDYGFAAEPSAWATIMTNYSDQAIINKNWLYLGLNEFTITFSTKTISKIRIYIVDSTGAINSEDAYQTTAIRPVFYLEQSIKYSSGSGTRTDPYRIME